MRILSPDCGQGGFFGDLIKDLMIMATLVCVHPWTLRTQNEGRSLCAEILVTQVDIFRSTKEDQIFNRIYKVSMFMLYPFCLGFTLHSSAL